MGIPSQQIGWSQKDKLLWNISKQLEQLTQVAGNIQIVPVVPTTTTTTTIAGTTTTTTSTTVEPTTTTTTIAPGDNFIATETNDELITENGNNLIMNYPLPTSEIITEDGNFVITENGDNLTTQ